MDSENGQHVPILSKEVSVGSSQILTYLNSDKEQGETTSVALGKGETNLQKLTMEHRSPNVSIDSTFAQQSIDILQHLNDVLKQKDEKILELQRVCYKLELNHEKLNQYESVVNSNKDLKKEIFNSQQTLREKDETIANLHQIVEELKEKLKSMTSNVKQPSDAGMTSPSQSLVNSGVSYSQTFSLDGPMSLPVDPMTQSYKHEINKLNDEIKSMHFNMKKMRDMNLQWQQYDQQRENFVKLIQEEAENLKHENDNLKSENQALISSSASGSLQFSPAQQEYIDKILKKLRSEADRFKELAEINATEGQRNLNAEKKLRQDTEKKADELNSKINEMQLHEQQIDLQCEELRSALVVATRAQQYPIQRLPDDQQNTINTLREEARQYAIDSAKLQDELRETKTELQLLREQLPRPNQTASLSGSFVPAFPTAQQIPSTEGGINQSSNWINDIETDVGQMHSMPVQPQEDEIDISSSRNNLSSI